VKSKELAGDFLVRAALAFVLLAIDQWAHEYDAGANERLVWRVDALTCGWEDPLDAT